MIVALLTSKIAQFRGDFYLVIVLVLDFFGRGKRADCQQRSKIENEDDDEDDWRGAYPPLYTYKQRPSRAPGHRHADPSKAA